ncbi:unnamed protein product [Allacma fusca]|uniref:G-protein coupled receptors family 1 profile domain-containing protein n=1 Tax=Allacma fusca TaxID=39272 RepID=A0A8J2KPM8_9HEXA|nr:unnamed protein product [Allacma fusca]
MELLFRIARKSLKALREFPTGTKFLWIFRLEMRPHSTAETSIRKYLVEYFQKLSVPFAHLIWRRHIISCFLECPTFQSRNPGLTFGKILAIAHRNSSRSGGYSWKRFVHCDSDEVETDAEQRSHDSTLEFGSVRSVHFRCGISLYNYFGLLRLVALRWYDVHSVWISLLHFRPSFHELPCGEHLLTSGLSWWAVGISWGHALFWTASPLLGWSSYTFEPTGISCSLNWHDRSTSGMAYTLACTIFCYVTHVMALLWFYREIFAKVHNLGFSRNWRDRQQQIIENEIPSPSPLARCESVVVFSFITENLSPLEIHVLRMNVIMVLSFLICWSPYAIVSVISIFNDNLHPVW